MSIFLGRACVERRKIGQFGGGGERRGELCCRPHSLSSERRALRAIYREKFTERKPFGVGGAAVADALVVAAIVSAVANIGVVALFLLVVM